MKIIILTQYYLPEIGAPQARLSELAKHFSKLGNEVTILTAMPNYPTGYIFEGYGGLSMTEKIDNINIIRSFIFPSKSVKIIPRLMNYFSFVISSTIIGLIKLSRGGLLIVESPPLLLGISGYLLKLFKNYKLIFNVSDLWPDSAVQLGILKKGNILNLSLKLEKFCYKKSWLVTGQSREIVSNIKSRYPKIETYRFSNGVNTDMFHPRKKTLILDQWSSRKQIKIIYAGLFGIAQGLDQILLSAKILKDENIQIILIGDGPEKDNLDDLKSKLDLKNISFVAPQKRDKIPELLASADIGLVCLKKHIPGAVPSKLYEAMASGLPVIMIGEGEPSEIVSKNNCGISVKPGDPNKIADAMRKLSSDPNLRNEMRSSSRKVAVREFNRSTILEQFYDYLKKKSDY